MIRIRTGTNHLGGETVILHEQVENGAIVGQIHRKPLPNRRPAVTIDLPWNGRRFHLTVGFDPRTAKPAEVFIAGARAGSEQDHLLDDCCIAVSKLLQCGADPKELAETFGNQSIMGAVAVALSEMTED